MTARKLTPIYNLDPNVKRQIEALAKTDDRTVSKQIQVLLKEAIAARTSKTAE